MLIEPVIFPTTAQCRFGHIQIDHMRGTASDGGLFYTENLPPESLLWPTPSGDLMADDPRQTKLELKAVAVEPERALKEVSA